MALTPDEINAIELDCINIFDRWEKAGSGQSFRTWLADRPDDEARWEQGYYL